MVAELDVQTQVGAISITAYEHVDFNVLLLKYASINTEKISASLQI